MELASLTDLVDLDFGGRSPRAPFGEGISSDFFFFSEALRRKDMAREGGWGGGPGSRDVRRREVRCQGCMGSGGQRGGLEKRADRSLPLSTRYASWGWSDGVS
jgi:hypothetical protein